MKKTCINVIIHKMIVHSCSSLVCSRVLLFIRKVPISLSVHQRWWSVLVLRSSTRSLIFFIVISASLFSEMRREREREKRRSVKSTRVFFFGRHRDRGMHERGVLFNWCTRCSSEGEEEEEDARNGMKKFTRSGSLVQNRSQRHPFFWRHYQELGLPVCNKSNLTLTLKDNFLTMTGEEKNEGMHASYPHRRGAHMTD